MGGEIGQMSAREEVNTYCPSVAPTRPIGVKINPSSFYPCSMNKIDFPTISLHKGKHNCLLRIHEQDAMQYKDFEIK